VLSNAINVANFRALSLQVHKTTFHPAANPHFQQRNGRNFLNTKLLHSYVLQFCGRNKGTLLFGIKLLTLHVAHILLIGSISIRKIVQIENSIRSMIECANLNSI
jgi:hypothetical protein